MPSASVANTEVLEVGIRGPDGATHMFVCTGRANFSMTATDPAQTTTWRFHVGPPLTRRQFIRATAMVSIAELQINGTTTIFTKGPHLWSIDVVDADWDDESGEVEVSVELSGYGSDLWGVTIRGLAYHVVIIAQIS